MEDCRGQYTENGECPGGFAQAPANQYGQAGTQLQRDDGRQMRRVSIASGERGAGAERLAHIRARGPRAGRAAAAAGRRESPGVEPLMARSRRGP